MQPPTVAEICAVCDGLIQEYSVHRTADLLAKINREVTKVLEPDLHLLQCQFSAADVVRCMPKGCLISPDDYSEFLKVLCKRWRQNIALCFLISDDKDKSSFVDSWMQCELMLLENQRSRASEEDEILSKYEAFDLYLSTMDFTNDPIMNARLQYGKFVVACCIGPLKDDFQKVRELSSEIASTGTDYASKYIDRHWFIYAMEDDNDDNDD
jgi:hypothetical protein